MLLCANCITNSVRFSHLQGSDLLLADFTCQNVVLKMDDRVEMMSEKLENMSKFAGLGAAIAAELMIGFWFGIGVILAIGVGDGLNYFAGALTSSGTVVCQ